MSVQLYAQKINRQNNRWLCVNPRTVPVVMSTKFPTAVMVMGVISNEGDMMSPHFFERGLRLNSAGYIDVMRDVIKPWMDQVAGGRPYVFCRMAPLPTMHSDTELALREHPQLLGEGSPSSSPDCNPHDYYVWGACERTINRSPHNTLDSLKTSIVAGLAAMPPMVITRACSRYHSRIQGVIEARGSFIE